MAGSWRTAPLPKGWAKTRARILRRDAYLCRLRYPGCTTDATQVDHINGPNDHRDTSLQAVCEDCHKVKTYREAHPPRRRPAEQHPGLI